MANIMKVMKKEFADIGGNRSIFLILAIFTLLIFISIFNAYDVLKSSSVNDTQILQVILGWISNAIMTYGSIVAMMIGFSAISNEKKDNALNTLATKPLYRDTIITGKMISCTIFISIMFAVATMLYTAVLLIVCGNVVSAVIGEYINRLPFVFLMSSLVAIAYMSVSILIPIWVKRHGVALLSIVITFMMLKTVIPTLSFAGNIYILTNNGEIYKWILRLCPDTAYTQMMLMGLYDPSIDIFRIVSICWMDIVCLLLFIISITFLSYASFIRRDIA
jgi:ABC-2 type transport system permease protein